MRQAQTARQQLNGHWTAAIAVESLWLSARAVLLCLELLFLRISGQGMERPVHAPQSLPFDPSYVCFLLAALLINDWLLAPLQLGRAAFYWRLSGGHPVSFKTALTFLRPTAAHPHPWLTSLYWRWGIAWRRAATGLLCLFPAALALGYTDVLRNSGRDTLSADVLLLIGWLIALLLLGLGILWWNWWQLLYLPTAYLLIEGVSPREKVFRHAARCARHQRYPLCRVYFGFLGWFITCLSLFPYGFVAPLFQTTRCLAVRTGLCAFQPSARHAHA